MAQEKMFEHRLQSSGQKMQNEGLSTVEKNAADVVGEMRNILDRVMDIDKRHDDLATGIRMIEESLAHPDPMEGGKVSQKKFWA